MTMTVLAVCGSYTSDLMYASFHLLPLEGGGSGYNTLVNEYQDISINVLNECLYI